jgi:hypothetical protein
MLTENKAPFIVECVVAFKGTLLALVDSSASRGILKFDAWDDLYDDLELLIVDGGAGGAAGAAPYFIYYVVKVLYCFMFIAGRGRPPS